MSDSLIGKQLGDYQIRELLGRGGMARVYVGYDARLDRQAAVKVINSDFSPADRTEYFERFQREARAIARLNHPNIVGVYQFGQYEDSYYMAMVFVEGRDLRQILREYHDRRETPPLSDAQNVARGIGSALDYAHSRGVIHRDVKPSNIMLTRDNRAILTDFGLALTSNEGTRGETFGSAHYIAPEQAVSSAKAVPQSDLYSLGVCLYEMLTGQVPFDDPSAMTVALKHLQEPPPPPRQINPHLAPAVEFVLLRALDKDPARRFPSGMELSHALDSALENQGLPDTSQINIAQVRANVKPVAPAPAAAPAKGPPETPPSRPTPLAQSPLSSIPPPPVSTARTEVGGVSPPKPPPKQPAAPPIPTKAPEIVKPRRASVRRMAALIIFLAALVGGGYVIARNAGLIRVVGLVGTATSSTPGKAASSAAATASPRSASATGAATNAATPSASDGPSQTPIALLSPGAIQTAAETSAPLASEAATTSVNPVSGTANATSTSARADVLLVYDQDQFDLVNVTSSPLPIRGMTFMQDITGREFDPSTTWLPITSDSLLPQFCYQVFRNSRVVNAPLTPKECNGRAAYWGTSDARAFWVALTSSPATPPGSTPTTFSVLFNGKQVTSCQVVPDSGPSSNPTSSECSFVLPG